MSSLHDHVAQNRTKGDAKTEAETALLNAISKAVGEIEAGGGDVDIRGPRLKALAEVYALVVHGRA
ncbi:hypothetical protein ACFWHW_03805 [Streptomyces pharetrae]|uniref:hypothetical protein n=1 Tax=Streptomyces pharetrae TaxID=291370 RepID=UPI00365E2C91